MPKTAAKATGKTSAAGLENRIGRLETAIDGLRELVEKALQPFQVIYHEPPEDSANLLAAIEAAKNGTTPVELMMPAPPYSEPAAVAAAAAPAPLPGTVYNCCEENRQHEVIRKCRPSPGYSPPPGADDTACVLVKDGRWVPVGGCPFCRRNVG